MTSVIEGTITGPRHAQHAPTTVRSQQLAANAKRLLLFAGALGVSAMVCWLIVRNLSSELSVRTDVVGNPTFTNFNIRWLSTVFWMIVAAFPLLTCVLYAVGARILNLRDPRPLRLVAPQLPDDCARPAPVAVIGRLLVGASPFALVAAVLFGRSGPRFWIVLGAVFAIYPVGLYLASRDLVLRRTACFGDLRDALTMVNALVAPLALLGLYGLSRITKVTVVQDGVVHRYPWLSLWVVAVLTAAVLATVAVALRRAETVVARARIEQSIVLYVSGSIIVAILFSQLPPALVSVDAFHEGEGLAAARLVQHGALLWRDFISIHGLFQDVIRPSVGVTLVENSAWGAWAGVSLVLVPLYYVFWYMLCVRLFRRHCLYLAVAVVVVVASAYAGASSFLGMDLPSSPMWAVAHLRLLLLPLALLFLLLLLERDTWPRAAAFAACMLAQFLVTPESAYILIAAGITLVAYDWLHRPSGALLLSAFTRTLRVGVASLFGGFAFVAYLVVTGSLHSYIGYFRTFAADHDLTGGVPIRWHSYTGFDLQVVLPIVLVLACIWYVVANLRARRYLSLEGWVMVTLAGGVALYYNNKFLGRADNHILHVWALVIPLIGVSAVLMIEKVGSHLTGGRGLSNPMRKFVKLLPAAGVSLVVITISAVPFLGRVEGTAARLERIAPVGPAIRGVGFMADANAQDQMATTLTDLSTAMRTVLQPGDTVFDFTNQPLVFYYLLTYLSPTRYYHVSMAIRRDTQRDLIAELEAARPSAVIYNNDGTGGFGGLVGGWDAIPDAVRHYDVSAYVLAHYKPLVWVRGYTLFIRNDLSPATDKLDILQDEMSLRFDDLYFTGMGCLWGYVPNFFSVTPTGDEDRSRPLERYPVIDAVTVTGHIAAAGRTALMPTSIVALLDDRVVARSPVTTAGEGSQFSMDIPRVSRNGAAWNPRLVALYADGAARSVIYGKGVDRALSTEEALPQQVHSAGSEYTVIRQNSRPAASQAVVDTATPGAAPLRRELVFLPPDARSRYRWLELEAADGFADDSYTLSDNAALSHEIGFKTLPGSTNPYVVRLDNCPQWFGYATDALLLDHKTDVGPTNLRLVSR